MRLREHDSLGKAIRAARETQRMTLRELGAAVGVTASFLSDLEHDRRSTTKLLEIAKVLGVPLSVFVAFGGVTRDLTDWLSVHPKEVARLRMSMAREAASKEAK